LKYVYSSNKSIPIHIISLFFSYQITKLRVNTWKTSAGKSYKHVALIQLSDINSLFDIPSTNDGKKETFSFSISVSRVSLCYFVILLIENEQFGMLCSIDGQARQLIFRVADNNNNNNMSISRSYLTDSITSLSTISSLNQTNKTEVLQYLAKAIAEERCLPDRVKENII